MIPSTRVIFRSRAKIIRIKEIITLRGMSLLRMSGLTLNAEIAAQTPTTISMLKIFDPTMLLTAMSLFPEIAAVILTEASGALVPIATMVSPITALGTRRILARDEPPSTKKSAPLIKNANPMMSKRYSIKSPFPVRTSYKNV